MRRMTAAAASALMLMVIGVAHGRSSCADATHTPARYRIDAAEVHDKHSGLIWQRCSAGQHWRPGEGCIGVIIQMGWQEAVQMQNRQWRLPRREELATLIDTGCGRPAIDEQAFPDMELTKLWYWTASTEGALAWYVAFGGGSQQLGNPLSHHAVRLVKRSATPHAMHRDR